MLAKSMGVSIGSIHNWINELVDGGHLIVVSGGKGRRGRFVFASDAFPQVDAGERFCTQCGVNERLATRWFCAQCANESAKFLAVRETIAELNASGQEVTVEAIAGRLRARRDYRSYTKILRRMMVA